MGWLGGPAHQFLRRKVTLLRGRARHGRRGAASSAAVHCTYPRRGNS